MIALAFGLAAGMGAAAFRDGPPLAHGSKLVLWFVMVAGMLIAYVIGRRRRPGAVAIAQATSIAEATASAASVAEGGKAVVNLFVAPHEFSRSDAGRQSPQGHADSPAASISAGPIPAVRVPEHLAAPLTVYEQHADILEDYEPADLLAMHEAGELDEEQQ